MAAFAEDSVSAPDAPSLLRLTTTSAAVSPAITITASATPTTSGQRRRLG